jgi:hypothetical protein
MIEDYLGSFKHLHPLYTPAFLHDMHSLHDTHSKFSAFEKPIGHSYIEFVAQAQI